MSPFTGFPSGKVKLTRIPAQFFTELLPEIDSLAEIKVTLYALWALDRQEGTIRYLSWKDFTGDRELLKGLGQDEKTGLAALEEGLDAAVRRGSLLRFDPPTGQAGERLFFTNSPRGRAALQALQKGEWSPGEEPHPAVTLELDRPNIYRLYEENIGPLTPMVADMLREAEQTYPVDWIEHAMRLAVQNNKRHWRYVEAILRRWKEGGRDETDRRDTEKGRRKYVEGEFADFVKH